jgi:predicted RNase H-like HicB family nuclease
MNPERQAMMKLTVEYEQEEDGRWLAEVKELPGVLVYGQTPDEAVAHAQALALRVIADRIENGESAPALMFSFAAA